jgi:hypothetical protein
MHSPLSPSRPLLRRLARLVLVVGLAVPTIAAFGASGAAASSRHKRRHDVNVPPLKVTVFSPGSGDMSGSNGSGFIVDLAIDATTVRSNPLLSEAAGYKPFFNDPTSSTFHPGPDPGAPGLVVLLSTTPDNPGTPLLGPDTNLAGLFQLNGVADVGGLAEAWNTWQVGKPLFGVGRATLTVYVVAGTAPGVVAAGEKAISNIVRVPFVIA